MGNLSAVKPEEVELEEALYLLKATRAFQRKLVDVNKDRIVDYLTSFAQ